GGQAPRHPPAAPGFASSPGAAVLAPRGGLVSSAHAGSTLGAAASAERRGARSRLSTARSAKPSAKNIPAAILACMDIPDLSSEDLAELLDPPLHVEEHQAELGLRRREDDEQRLLPHRVEDDIPHLPPHVGLLHRSAHQ